MESRTGRIWSGGFNRATAKPAGPPRVGRQRKAISTRSFNRAIAKPAGPPPASYRKGRHSIRSVSIAPSRSLQAHRPRSAKKMSGAWYEFQSRHREACRPTTCPARAPTFGLKIKFQSRHREACRPTSIEARKPIIDFVVSIAPSRSLQAHLLQGFCYDDSRCIVSIAPSRSLQAHLNWIPDQEVQD